MKILHNLKIILPLFIFLFILFHINVYRGETNYARFNDFSIGLKGTANFSKLPYDLLFGVSINSPYIFGNWVSLRLEADLGYLRGITNAIISNEFVMYYNAYKAGIAVKANQKTQTVRPYVELGWIGIQPSKIATDDSFPWGIYGIFGFDLLFDPASMFGFFFETGATGLLSGGNAEKLIDDTVNSRTIPKRYGSGIIFSGGLRLYF